jgi:hypothetical protein
VRQERKKIPSHQTACHTSLEADHHVGSERELRHSQALVQVPAAAAELAAAREEIERLRATVTEQAVALHLHQGKSSWD